MSTEPKLKKRISRVFNTALAVPLFDDVALEVINSIENDRLLVFDQNDINALDDLHPGVITPLGRATVPVSIREWLCVGCQVIRWDIGNEFEQARKKGVMGRYQHNAPDVIYPEGTIHRPPGPSAFYGQIILDQDHPRFGDDDVFPFVLAHELVHVFDMLRFLVPAMRNWKAFWSNVLQEGAACDRVRLAYNSKAAFLDDYGSENELAMISEYWPSRAKRWFDASRA